MSKAKYWKLPGGRYGGITARGKRFIVDSLAKAKTKLGKTRSRKTRASNPKKRRVKRIARRKKGRRRYGMTIPIAPIVGLIPMVSDAAQSAMAGDWDMAFKHLQWKTLGIDSQGKFHMDQMIMNIVPVIGGLLVHKFVGGPPLNLNRILARARVPFIRI